MNFDEILAVLIRSAIKIAREVTDDQEALAFQCLYKEFNAQLGKQLNVGEYIQHEGKLYRVLQAHVAQAHWAPGAGTESLFTVIDKAHAGTPEDPIPWSTNMECFNGKYYIFEGALYFCIRDSGIALHCNPTDVLGNYFNLYASVKPEEPQEPEEEPVVPEEPQEPEEEPPVEAEEGTLQNPIPYSTGTVVFNGKYYSQNDQVYLCIRDSGNALYHDIIHLLGNYFQEA